jgi:succinate-acetate transporter protein
MIANTAFLAALTVFLLVTWLAGELTFLSPSKAVLFRDHGVVIVGGVLVLFLHLSAVYYALARWIFLRDTGRKLTHVDQQLTTPEGVHQELRDHLRASRRI